MKRMTAWFLMMGFLVGAGLYAAEDRGGGGNERNEGSGGASNRSSAPARQPMRASRPAQARQPVVIHMNHSAGGSHYQPAKKPSYGQTQWNRTSQTRAAVKPAPRVQATRQLKTAPAKGVRLANAVHHQTYSQGYVRKQLSNIGVKKEPSYITDRSEIVSTDRAHSMIGKPSTGPKGEAFKGSLVSERKFNGSVVRHQMSIVNDPAYLQRIAGENRTETQRGRYYWHGAKGVDYSYAHYIDNSGYHWYGWYSGDNFFWTRNYDGRWWWYDSGFNRWCFYNDDYWWWQDPYHVGELYVYNDDNYIPANSADDPVVVAGSEQPNDAVYNSPDSKRTVKIALSDGDAFLYDTANPPSFDPIYMASGVQSVQYSDVNNGRPLEIILKLNDGSYDLFDAWGHPYNSETSESD